VVPVSTPLTSGWSDPEGEGIFQSQVGIKCPFPEGSGSHVFLFVRMHLEAELPTQEEILPHKDMAMQ